MSHSRRKHKGRCESGGFFAIPHAVMRSANWLALPPRAVKLVCDLGGQYRGTNNGDLSAAWKIMRSLGWKSGDTLAKAIADALRFGMIEKTRQGGMHKCSLYALTWRPIDECGGKLEVSATHTPSRLWEQPPVSSKESLLSTKSVATRPGIRSDSCKAA
ncbi:MAG TPA: hypothetical protein VJR95_12685 [Rhodanobacter sp.]|nr:hypothetical protein [Rhodanobacter sp.]